MRLDDPNLPSLELAASALGSLLEELVLVGGCATGLLITDPGVPAVRATLDVDWLTEVTPLASYYALCERLRERGFSECPEVICRWQKGALKVDVMSTDPDVLGFSNTWYGEAARSAQTHVLPSGAALSSRRVRGPVAGSRLRRPAGVVAGWAYRAGRYCADAGAPLVRMVNRDPLTRRPTPASTPPHPAAPRSARCRRARCGGRTAAACRPGSSGAGCGSRSG